MILTGAAIKDSVLEKKIKIEPFCEDQVTTNSYDLNLGCSYIKYSSEILDPRIKPDYVISSIPEKGLILEKNDFILASSQQKVGSDYYVPIIHAKSGIARLGLFVHVTADLIDIGSFGSITFQLYATLPIRIYAGMKLAQVTFWVPKGDISLYQGKYQGSDGPQISKIYFDFNNFKAKDR